MLVHSLLGGGLIFGLFSAALQAQDAALPARPDDDPPAALPDVVEGEAPAAPRLVVNELLANPRLEHGAAGWTLTSATPLDQGGRDGGAVVRLFTGPEVQPPVAGMHTYLPGFAPGRNLRLSVRARGRLEQGVLQFGITAGALNGTEPYRATEREDTLEVETDAWSTGAFEFFVPTGTTWMDVVVAMSGQGEVFVDDVSLCPVVPLTEPDPELAESLELNEWDALVSQALAFIEQVRGHGFSQLPRAHLMQPDEFVHAFPMPKLRDAEQRVRPMLRLLGVVPQDFDFDAVWSGIESEPPSGRWISWMSTGVIRSDVPREWIPGLLVHELTHAFDTEATSRLMRGKLNEEFDACALLAQRAVVEGIAMTVQGRWSVQSPTGPRMRDAAEWVALEAAHGEMPLEPGYPLAMGLLPYDSGWRFFEHGAAQFPEVSLDELFAQVLSDPPTTATQVLHPERYWGVEHSDPPAKLPVPALATLDDSPWQLLQSGTLGEPLLALATGHATLIHDDREAMRSLSWTHPPSEGWTGDAWQLYASPGGHSVLFISTWSDALDAAEFAAAVSLPHPFWVDRRDECVFVCAADDAQDLDVLRAAILDDPLWESPGWSPSDR